MADSWPGSNCIWIPALFCTSWQWYNLWPSWWQCRTHTFVCVCLCGETDFRLHSRHLEENRCPSGESRVPHKMVLQILPGKRSVLLFCLKQLRQAGAQLTLTESLLNPPPNVFLYQMHLISWSQPGPPTAMLVQGQNMLASGHIPIESLS